MCLWLKTSNSLVVKTDYGYYEYWAPNFYHRKLHSERHTCRIDITKIRYGKNMIHTGLISGIEYAYIEMYTKDISKGLYDFYIETAEDYIELINILAEYELLKVGDKEYTMCKPVYDDVIIRVCMGGEIMQIYKLHDTGRVQMGSNSDSGKISLAERFMQKAWQST